MITNISDLCVVEDYVLSRALEVMNETALGIVFVTDKSQKLVGVLTDGDVRRALLKNGQLQGTIRSIYNKNFFALPVVVENDAIIRSFTEQIRIIPLLDSEGKIVDYASAKRLRNIPIASPQLLGNELAYVSDCISSAWISSQGKYVNRFEEDFKSLCKLPEALAVSNGTVALHLALVALGIGPGDEVIVPDLTFAASANAVFHAGATPVLATIDRDTWTLSPESLTKLITKRTKAVMPVHLYGHPCDMDTISYIANQHGLLIVEDCAEALGSLYKGKPVGYFSDAATFSFFGNKTITTGEGGMVLFKNPEIGKHARMLRDHGMSPQKKYWHTEVGYNYRMTNIQAALGVAQMERLAFFVDVKRKIASGYAKILSQSPHIILPPEQPWAFNSYWLFTFLLKGSAPLEPHELRNAMSMRGIETRQVFYPLHTMPPYKNLTRDTDMRNSLEISARGISLPSYVQLTAQERDFIAEIIVKLIS